MKLPTIKSYYGYSSGNYGVNSLMVEFDSITLYYSYETIIAYITSKDGLVIRENDWSSTTGKHLNSINTNKKDRIDGELFEKQLSTVLEELGLKDVKCNCCDADMYGRVRIHHHTENDKDVTNCKHSNCDDDAVCIACNKQL